MFHAAAKILFFLFQPSSLAVMFTALGMALLYAGRRRAGAVYAGMGMAWLVGAGLLPIGNILIYPLEERFPLSATGTRLHPQKQASWQISEIGFVLQNSRYTPLTISPGEFPANRELSERSWKTGLFEQSAVAA